MQVEIAMRKDVFDNLTVFSAKSGLMGQLSVEQKRFVEKVINDKNQYKYSSTDVINQNLKFIFNAIKYYFYFHSFRWPFGIHLQ